MKKQYIKPTMEVYLIEPSELLAGSMGPNGQQDPSMAPVFDDDVFTSPTDDIDAFFAQ